MTPTVEFIYFDGCPNAAAARANLAAALRAANLPTTWREWEQSDPAAPPYARQFGSPTVLVNARDVTGGAGSLAGSACRADGAPSIEILTTALTSAS